MRDANGRATGDTVHAFCVAMLEIVDGIYAAHEAGNQEHAEELARFAIAGHHLAWEAFGFIYDSEVFARLLGYAYAGEEIHPSHTAENRKRWMDERRNGVLFFNRSTLRGHAQWCVRVSKGPNGARCF